MLSGVRAAFTAGTLMGQEGVMLRASDNTCFCSLASTEVSRASRVALGCPGVAGRCHVGPVGELLTSGVGRGTLSLVSWSISGDTLCLCVVNDLGPDCLVHYRGCEALARPVVARQGIKRVSERFAIQQRMCLVLIGML